MTDPDKDAARAPREWFVDRRTLSNKPTGWHTELTLIEKSAYDALKSRLADEEMKRVEVAVLLAKRIEEHDSLRAEVERLGKIITERHQQVTKLKAALKDIANDNVMPEKHKTIARRALTPSEGGETDGDK